MKKLALFSLLVLTFAGTAVYGQDKSQRASPPATATATTDNGLVITINYSQPSLKGRTLGVDIAPFGKVWRTGANEATTFEISKDAKVGGKLLKAGKYSLYSIPGSEEATLIFNKSWKQWGTVYNEADDELRIKVQPRQADGFSEKMQFTVAKTGQVTFTWGNGAVDFNVD